MFAPKRIFRRAALVAVPLVLLAACGGDDPTTAATVDGTDIPASEVEALAEAISGTPQYEQLDGADAEDQARADALGQLIFAVVLRAGAADLGIELDDDDIEDTLTQIAQEFGGDVEDMYAELGEQGMDREEVDRQIELFALEDAVMTELSPGVTDEAVEEAYEGGVPARHILVEESDQAVEAIDRITGGEDFADVAAETSTDSSAPGGGELGFIQPGMTVPEFEDALFGADEGELVGPVESDFGFHVIERLPKPELADVEDDIRAALEQMTMQEAQTTYQDFIRDRMESADITVDSAFGRWDPEIGQVVLD
jgi:parvulin-like peptidyl-prolyl isomerase